jgi:molecular chaperone GrpE
MAKKKPADEQAPEIVEEQVEETPEPSELERVQTELQTLKDQVLRDRAELENFKRRMNEERIKERKYIHQDILKKVVDVLDNLERAVAHEYEDITRFKDGLGSVIKLVEKMLTDESVEKIESLHQPFDATIHQAVSTVVNNDVDEQTIVEVYQDGYKYKDRILRPSMVVVSKKEE